MKTIDFYVSRAKTSGLLVAGLVMIGAGWFCTTIPSLKCQIIGWVGIVFFGACMLAGIKQLCQRGPVLILEESGIRDIRSFGLIPWNDVEKLSIGSIRSQRFLCVYVHEPQSYLSRLSKLKRSLAKGNVSLGFSPITLSFAGISPGIDECWSFITSHHPEKIYGAGSRSFH